MIAASEEYSQLQVGNPAVLDWVVFGVSLCMCILGMYGCYRLLGINQSKYQKLKEGDLIVSLGDRDVNGYRPEPGLAVFDGQLREVWVLMEELRHIQSCGQGCRRW